MIKKLVISALFGLVCAVLAYLLWEDYVTALFIGVIMGTFSFFGQEIYRLNLACRHLNNLKNSDIFEISEESNLYDIIEAYKKTINIEVDKIQKSNIPAIEIINIQSLAKTYNVNLKALDSASGMLVGLGLMGTFLGLTFGIAKFDSSNSENIQISIQKLLNGMYIAFLTSLFGMGSSLLNTGFDKHWRNKLQLYTKDITDKLDSQYYIDDIELLELRQRSKFEFTDDEGNKVSVSTAIGRILEESESQTKALSSFNTDLSTMLNNSLGEQIELKLAPKMNAVIEHIDKLAETVVSPANDMMEKVALELKQSMNLIVDEFKQKVSDTATQQLESISQSLVSATKAIDLLPENVTNAINSMQDAIASVEKSMLKLTEDMMSKQADLLALQESTTAETKNLIEDLKTSIDRLDEVNGNYSETITSFRKVQINVEKSLENLSVITTNMQRAILNFQSSQADYGENMKQLQIQSQGSIDSISQLVTHSGELSKEYASQFGVIKEGLVDIFGKLKEGLEEYSKTMQQTTQDYLQQYTSTLTETADNLKTSIDILGDTVSELSEILEKNKK